VERKAFDGKDLVRGVDIGRDADVICGNDIGDGVVARGGIDVRGTSIWGVEKTQVRLTVL
jgi:hypothetical protein